jgi:hypothetical protein
VIPIAQHDGVHLLAGAASLNAHPLEPYAEPVLTFLAELSDELRHDAASATLGDVASFAFSIRRGRLQQLQAGFNDQQTRLGLGTVLHIAPSNVPVNFAFSYVFGLLAGNANIVRVPSRDSVQVDAICAACNRVFAHGDHEVVRQRTAMIRYDRNDLTSAALSQHCQGRVVWGGDDTLRHMRAIPLPVRAVEIGFADRYSFCIIDADAVAGLDRLGLQRLARDFFNDTYLMDQNACSSPHLVVWRNAPRPDIESRFWDAVEQVVRERYPLRAIQQIDKYTHLMQDALALDGNAVLQARHDEYVYRIRLDELPANAECLRGRFGYFYEFHTSNLQQLVRIVTPRYQTLTYFGLDREQLRQLVTHNGLLGIDRIVPIGKALDIDVIWDGHDMVRSLSRVIDVR